MYEMYIVYVIIYQLTLTFSLYKILRIDIPLTALTLPHFYACSKPELGFPTSYVVVFYVFNEFS
jgi:hypothetical protein